MGALVVLSITCVVCCVIANGVRPSAAMLWLTASTEPRFEPYPGPALSEPRNRGLVEVLRDLWFQLSFLPDRPFPRRGEGPDRRDATHGA
jgi:hypothetical protein